MLSSRNSSGKRASSSATATLRIKCSFCGNTYYAPPRDAVCPKCERPANRDLPLSWRAFALLLPPLGALYALVIRSHSPVAAMQSLSWSLGGAALWAVPLLLRAWN